ncbi:MAG: hypothetical protein JWM52_691 [Candidatus Saccharibacteria bacterium]|nr:hypothetical protein [Candidatus Saccharibacteria bacterium]
MAAPRGGRSATPAKPAATPAPAKVPATSATVTIAGVRGSFSVDYDQDKTTIADVVKKAAEQAGVKDLVVETLAVVVNGETAALTDKAPATGGRVSAAPAVRNG